VNMTGACSGCQMASTTLEGIQQRIVEDLGEFVRVLPAGKGQLGQGQAPRAEGQRAPA